LQNSNNLFAIAFDVDRLAVKGSPVSVVESVGRWAVSDAGMLVYIPATTNAVREDASPDAYDPCWPDY
jgi:hypothetical protein